MRINWQTVPLNGPPKLLVQWICKSVIETGLDHSSIKILWSELVFLLLLNGISDDTWLGRGGPLQWWSEYRYLDGDARFIYIARELATWSEVNAFWRGLSSRFSFENCGIDSKLRIGVHWWPGPNGIPGIPGSRDFELIKIPGFFIMKSRDFSGSAWRV